MLAVAVIGAGNVAAGALPPEASSEVKRKTYSIRFRFAILLSDRGGSRIFIGEGLQVLGAPFWLLKGCRIYLEGAVMVKKTPFRARSSSLLARGAPYLRRCGRRATSWTKRARSLIRKAHSLADRRPHNAFGAKADPGLS